MAIGTREQQLKYQGASVNDTRRYDNALTQDKGGLVIEAATIAGVNSTNSFDDSAGGLPVFTAGTQVFVQGLQDNGGVYRVSSSDANSLVVEGRVVVDEAEGSTVIIRSGDGS